jgi:hypothetical protein
MKLFKIATVFLLATFLAIGGTLAADKWLHVRVEDNGADEERISVNIPLSLVESMLPLIEIDEFHKGKFDLDGELEGIDLRELAAALRDAPDAEFVKVESKNEQVHVSKEGDFIIVRAEDRGGRSNETVRVRMPLSVIDALMGEDGDELDLVAAVRELSRYDDDALVDVVSDDSSVRVWIDSDESGR